MANGWNGNPPIPVLQDFSAARSADTVEGWSQAVGGSASGQSPGLSAVWLSGTAALAVGACRIEQLRRAGAWRPMAPGGSGVDSERRVAAAEALLAERWDELAQRRRELLTLVRDGAAADTTPQRERDVFAHRGSDDEAVPDAELACHSDAGCASHR
ncbi:hypothetical protein [Caldimonas brevitalea]|nr:hypothetical protein [Caldimonas brevitalea]